MTDSQMMKTLAENAPELVVILLVIISVITVMYKLMIITLKQANTQHKEIMEEQRLERISHKDDFMSLMNEWRTGVKQICDNNVMAAQHNCESIISAIDVSGKAIMEALKHHDDQAKVIYTDVNIIKKRINDDNDG